MGPLLALRDEIQHLQNVETGSGVTTPKSTRE
jgi:hypothetical protein